MAALAAREKSKAGSVARHFYGCSMGAAIKPSRTPSALAARSASSSSTRRRHSISRMDGAASASPPIRAAIPGCGASLSLSPLSPPPLSLPPSKAPFRPCWLRAARASLRCAPRQRPRPSHAPAVFGANSVARSKFKAAVGQSPSAAALRASPIKEAAAAALVASAESTAAPAPETSAPGEAGAEAAPLSAGKSPRATGWGSQPARVTPETAQGPRPARWSEAASPPGSRAFAASKAGLAPRGRWGPPLAASADLEGVPEGGWMERTTVTPPPPTLSSGAMSVMATRDRETPRAEAAAVAKSSCESAPNSRALAAA
mmetsp:Transcript_29189/g.65366  ORF Transcript_29189/g.65366 Transcript_29189/m.65366 type:complete len:316 (-) Transcript_29189:883-1830(-)